MIPISLPHSEKVIALKYYHRLSISHPKSPNPKAFEYNVKAQIVQEFRAFQILFRLVFNNIICLLFLPKES